LSLIPPIIRPLDVNEGFWGSLHFEKKEKAGPIRDCTVFRFTAREKLKLGNKGKYGILVFHPLRFISKINKHICSVRISIE